MNEHTTDYTQVVPTEVILDSRAIGLNRYFGDEGALPQLLVLVEDEEDKGFWQKVFSCVTHKYSSIDIWPLSIAAENSQEQYDGAGNVLTAKGKDALMKVVGLGPNKMVAIDADYDLLVDELHNYTDRVRHDNYVQRTTYHSIENHLLDDPQFTSLPEMQAFCNAIEDYQYCIIGELMHHASEYESGRTYPLALTVKELRSTMGSYNYNHTTAAADLSVHLTTELPHIDPQRTIGYNDAKTLCASKHIDSTNIWQIVQGHTHYEFMSQVVISAMVRRRQTLESEVSSDPTIAKTDIPVRIAAIRHTLLGDYSNESAKFRHDVYSGQFLDMNSQETKTIQQKIISET